METTECIICMGEGERYDLVPIGNCEWDYRIIRCHHCNGSGIVTLEQHNDHIHTGGYLFSGEESEGTK